MSLTVHSSGGDFEQVPEGVYQARCYQLVDLGTQTSQFGEAKKIQVGWELFGETRKDGSPFVISSRYTASLNNKATLFKDLQAWRGKPFTEEELAAFDLQKIVGVPCQIQIQHKANADGTRTFANISALMSIPKGMTVPELTLDKQVLDLDEFDAAAFNALSNRLKLTVQSTPEWEAHEAEWTALGAVPTKAETDDDPTSQAIKKMADKVPTEIPANPTEGLDEAVQSLEPEYAMITPAQKQAIIKLLGAKGIALADERDRVIAAVAKQLGHGDVEGLEGLSKAWATDIIPELEKQDAEGLKLFFGAPVPKVAPAKEEETADTPF